LSEDGNFICFSNERRELFIVNIETGESRKVSPEEMKQYLPYSILPPKISDEKALKKAKWRLRQLGLKPEQFSVDNGVDERGTRKFVAAIFSLDGKALGPITIWIDLQTGKVAKEDLGNLKDKLPNR
jgi:hypothetical protein